MSKGGKTKTENKSTPIIPSGWQNMYDSTMGGIRDLTTRPALNTNQTTARDYFAGNLNRTPRSINPAQTITPQTIAGPQTITPQQIMASLSTGSQAEAMNPYSTTGAQWTDFSANKGSEFMKDYLDPMLSGYVDAAVADYDVGGERAMAAERARRGAGAAFGTGADVADAIRSGEINRGRGVLSGQLRGDAYKTAIGAGMTDADRFTATAGANAAGRYGASAFNAGQANNAAQTAFTSEAARRATNAGLTQNNSQFNAGATNAAATNNAANRLNADTTNAANLINVNTNNAGNRLTADTTNAANAFNVDRTNADLGLANDDFTMRNALGVAGMGDTEFAQGMAPWELMLQGINTGTSTFGNQSSGTQTYKPGLMDWAGLAVSAINPLNSAFGGGGGPTPISAASRVRAINQRNGWG